MSTENDGAGAICERVTSIIATHLSRPIKDVTPSARIVGDLGADSLDVAELLLILEDAFHVDIPTERAFGFVTVGDVVSFAEGLAVQGGANSTALPTGG